jgi:hypothetical protein
MVVNRWTWTMLALSLVTACAQSDGDASSQDEFGPLIYGVSYTVSADEYDDVAAEAEYEKCAALPGARAEGTDDSLPPGRTLRFTGSEAEQEEVAKCLASLTGAEVNGPFEPAAD